MADPTDTGGLQQAPLLRAIHRMWKRGAIERVALWLWPPLFTIVAFAAFLKYAPAQLDSVVAPSENPDGLQLKTLIRQVKTELQQADLEAIERNEPALFQLKDFELDVNVVARGTGTGSAEIVVFGSNVEVSRERIQRIHLRWIADPEARDVAAKQAKILDKPTDIIVADMPQAGGPK